MRLVNIEKIIMDRKKLHHLSQIINVLSYKGLWEELRNLIFIQKDKIGLRTASFHQKERIYPKGTVFFRIRRVNDLTNISYADFWEPPTEFIRRGRLNLEGEPMLYMSVGEINTPLSELNIKPNENFLLIAYIANKPLILSEVGFNQDKDKDSNIELIEFLDYHFMRTTDGAYVLSNLIAKELVKTSSSYGWCYPSTKSKNGINICLNVKYKSFIEILGALYCSIDDNEIKYHNAFKIRGEDEVSILKEKEEVSIEALRLYKFMESNNPDINKIDIDLSDRLDIRITRV